eukprot:2842727-Heterocapsa_arctica.AAC.1
MRGRAGRHLAAIGRVPWVGGGDWNLPPGAFAIEGASCTAGLANGAESKVEGDIAIVKHSPVRLKVGGKLSEDMGVKMKRPKAFQGMTRKKNR